MRSPGRRLIVDSPTAAVRRETVTTSSSDARSSATSAVISFVMLAIGSRSRSSLRGQHLARAGVLDEVRLRVDRRRRRGRDDGQEQRRGESQEEGNARFTRRPLYFTRMRWPIVRATGSMSGLSTSSCSTVVS